MIDKDTIAFMRDIASNISKVPEEVMEHYLTHEPGVDPRHPYFRRTKVLATMIAKAIDKACDKAEQ